MTSAPKKTAKQKPVKNVQPSAPGVPDATTGSAVASALKKSAKHKPPKILRQSIPMPAAMSTGSIVLDRLWEVVESRRDADPAMSHSARLLGRGTAKVAQKFGEEAVECLIEAVAGNRAALIAESADVLYHLVVLWVDAGLRPGEIWVELERREGVSGIAEKSARPRIETRKIP